jgi:bifunctional UDP-N-acetylglucosamine pyrophosphorylase / glucosamine-1-phosphate N-acetyltransferase
VLHEAGGLPLIGHVLHTALALAPAERIFVVTGHQAEQVRQAVEPGGAGIIHQAEQKGTGHALLAGSGMLSHLEGLLLILYGDSPLVTAATLRSLIEKQQLSRAAATIVTAHLEDPTGYGRILRDGGGHITGIVEQKAASPEQIAIREANVGVYCFRADLFWKHIGQIRPENPAREYYLTDMIEILGRAGHAIETLMAADVREFMGINDRLQLAEADRAFRQRKTRELMLAGVTIRNPETVTVDTQVAIGMDTVVEPFAQILGKSAIGENCRIGAGAILRDVDLADSVEIGPYTLVNRSRVESGAVVGPFARLRIDNHVEAGAQIGNFVELKKTRLGAGAKAMHLAYLGDAVIGNKANIGAGTITCNYDGKTKHGTAIGPGAFVGSNSTLVAPIEIGEGAYLAAGSVVTDSVPPDALALGRARQVIKEGWARKRRQEAKA